MYKFKVLAVAAMIVFFGSGLIGAANLDVSQPVQVTFDGQYERGQAIVYDGTYYWLFYGRSATVTGSYQTANPDTHDYEIYYKKASTVPDLASASANPVPGAAGSYLGEVGATVFNGKVWVFASIDPDPVLTGDKCYLYGWYTDDGGTTWNRSEDLVDVSTTFLDGQAHHDEIAFAGKLWLVTGHGKFYTRYASANPELESSWSTPLAVDAGIDGGLAHFFVEDNDIFLAIFSSGYSYIYHYDELTGVWDRLDEAVTSGWDPTLFKVNDVYVFAQAPWTDESGGRQYNIAWAGSDLSSVLSSGSPKMVTEGRYRTNTWVDMWPIGFTDAGGTSYLFFTSERDTPTLEGNGNIWYLEVDWDVYGDHYTYIQEAVDGALSGDLIDVAEGVYEEQIEISTNLTIAGAGKESTIIESPSKLIYSFTTSAVNYPIVYVHDADASIADVTIDGLGRGNLNYRFVGVGFWNAGGSITDCDITGIRNTPFDGSQHGNGIYSYNNTGGPYTIDVSGTAIDDFQKNAMSLSGAGLTANVSNCTATGVGLTTTTAQNGIQIGYGAGGTVVDCQVSGIGYTGTGWVASGMLFYNGTTVSVSGGSITGSQASLIYQETQGVVDGITITSTNVVSAEGISVRDYGYARLPDGLMTPGRPAPFEDDYVSADKIAATSVTVQNATITGVHEPESYGIAAWSLGENVNMAITNTVVTDWEIGVVAYESGSAVNLLVNDNDLSDNDMAVWSNALAVQDFRRNWWGDVFGPYQAITNIAASGNEVSDGVDYSPWWGDNYLASHVLNKEWYLNNSNGSTIQEGINIAVTGDIVNARPGMYVEQVVISKPLTVRGASYTANKNGYTVPVDYAWDVTVESIISNPSPTLVGNVVDIANTSDVVFEGFVVQALNIEIPSDPQLVRVYAGTQTVDNVVIRNNVIGPNTNVVSQDGTKGRMGLYLALPNYQNYDITNSSITGNKIFDCKGNGNDVFIWGGAEVYNPSERGDLTGTVIEDNEIYGGHRSGIEMAGSCDNLTIRNNEIYGNSGLPTDDPANLKYGNGILSIRIGSDKASPTAQGPDNLLIENNRIYGNEKNAIYLGPINTNHVITGNDMHDNGWDAVRIDLTEMYYGGLYPVYDKALNISANHNMITSNAMGAQLIGTPTNGFELDAANNYWGTVGCPAVAALMSGAVVYEPWCNSDLSDCSYDCDLDQVWVDDDYCNGCANDGHAWDYDAFTSVSAAVTAVNVNGVVHIAQGFYQEQVVIDKNLRLLGAGKDLAVIQSPVDMTAFFTTSSNNYPIIYVHNVDNVLIENLTVDGMGLGNLNSKFIGIGYYNAGGSVLDVHITGVRDTPFSGAQHGVSIYAYTTLTGPYTLNVTNVNIDDIQKNGMAFSGSALTVHVTNSSVTGAGPTTVTAQNGIQVGYGTDGSVTDCQVSGIYYSGPDWSASGLLLYYPGANMTLANNSIAECQGALNAYFADGLQMTDNTFTQNDFVFIWGGDGIAAEQNLFSGNTEAFYVADATNLTVTDNLFDGNETAVIIDGLVANIVFKENDIVNSSVAAAIVQPYETDNPAGVVFNHNNISLNAFGITNTTINMVAAAGNWWGDETGPGVVTKTLSIGTVVRPLTAQVGAAEQEQVRVPDGTTDVSFTSSGDVEVTAGGGNAVSAAVDYSPWWGDNYVGDDHSGVWRWCVDQSNGSTIAEGVDSASVNDIVDIVPGIYHNDIVTLTKKVSLLGAKADVDPAGSIDRGSETILTRDDANVLSIQPEAAGAVLNGLKFGTTTSGSGRHVFVNDATDVTIEYCIFYHTTEHGIALGSGADRGDISFNTINNSAQEGIVNMGADDVSISKNSIKNVDHFAVSTSGRATIAENTVLTCRDGIKVDYTGTGAGDRVEVINNNISYTEYAGINVTGAFTYIYDNTVHHCNYYGSDALGDWDYASIHLGGTATDCVIDGNVVFDGINGIQTWANGTQITNNEISYMGETYADTKLVGTRTYKNSAILVGSNWGVGDFDPTGVVVESNIMHDNYWGLFHSSGLGHTVMAEQNFWGTFDGPEDPVGTMEVTVNQCFGVADMKNTTAETVPSAGLGGGVGENVFYCPWTKQWSLCCVALRGNVDGGSDDECNIADLIYLVEYQFGDGPEPPCFEEVDVDFNGTIDIADLVYLVDYQFLFGPAPATCP